MNAPRPAPRFEAPSLDEVALARLLAEHGFRAEDRAAVRAFGRVIRRDALETAFLNDFLTREAAPALPAAAAAEAAFCDELLDVCAWDGSAAWFNRLTVRWCACRDLGVDAGFVWVCTGAMLSACREQLVGGRAEIFELELDLLTGLTRIVWALAAHLSTVSTQRERFLAQAEETAPEASGVPGRSSFNRLVAQLFAQVSADVRIGLLVIRLQVAPAREVLMPAERDRVHRALQDGWREVLRAEDLLFCIGESEWILVQPKVHTPAQVLLAANKLHEVGLSALARIGLEDGTELLFGGACAPDHGADAEQLERAARDALLAGSRSRQPMTLFGEPVRQALTEESEIEREFLRAIHLQRFELFLQPQINARDGRCESAEALLRWQRADGQWVPPPKVFEIAGRLNQQGQLSRLLIARAARMADELARSGVPIRIVLNLTADDVQDKELPDLIEQSMSNWHVPPERLGFELTEGAILSEKPEVERVLQRLRARGIMVALDDFGTGYSSLAHLRRLPVDELKIDRQFVAGMHTDPQDIAIIQAVLALAGAFGLQTVAEGVETAEQADELIRMGCDRLQGLWISPAIPVARFVPWWRQRRAVPEPA